MSALLRQSSLDSLGLQHGNGNRSSMNFNMTPGPHTATPAMAGEKIMSKVQSRMNEHSNAGTNKEDFSNRLEFRIKIKDLEVIKQAIDNLQSDKNEQYRFNKEEFVNLLANHFDKGTEQEYEELFDNIDVTQSGFVDWDKFTSYLLIMMYESDDRIKAFSIPNWKPIKQISNDSIKRCEFLKNLNRYITISKEGMVCLYDRAVNLTISTRVNTDSCKSKDLWITDFAVLGNVNKVALAFTTKEIGIYELNTKLELNCQYKVYNLKATPLCLDYWYDPNNPNDSILVWGDTAGECHTIHFNSTLIALFERPNTNVISSKHQNQSPNESCLNIALNEIKTNYKNAVHISFTSHSGWVRQVKWIKSLECVISCSTTSRKSVSIGWFNKKGSHIRVNYTVPIRAFEKSTHINVINGGVNGFDFDSKMNLLATANQNTLVNLFNPYVGEPNGILKGHSRVVLSVRFMSSRAQLISFAEDRTVRIWNVALQICIQRIGNIFPKGPEVDTMCAFDDLASRFFISFRFSFFMMEIKPEIVDRVMTHSNTVVAAKFNKHNHQIVTLSQDGNMFIWLIENGQKIKSFNDMHSGAELTALEFDEQGARFYTGASDGMIKVWDFNGHCYHTLEANEGANCEISQILAIKRRVLAMGWRRSLVVFRDSAMKDERVQAGEWNCVKDEHQEDILCAAIMTTQPMFLVTGGFDGDIVVWNSVTEQPYKHLSSRKKVSVIKKERPYSSKSSQSQNRKSLSRRMSKQINEATGELFDPENDFSKAVICLRVLNTRTYGKDCSLVSCGGNGWVRFWDIASGRVGAEFVAHQHVGSVIMERDESEHYLLTGDVNGVVKCWDISDYCLNFSSDSNAATLITEPPLVTTIKCHSDQINSLDFCNKNGRLYILVASSDCSVSLSDIKGNLIGIFGQELHWKLEPPVQLINSRIANFTPGPSSKFYSTSFAAARPTLPSIEVSVTQMNRFSAGEDGSSMETENLLDEEVRTRVENEYSKNCHLPLLKKQLSVDSTFEFEEDAFVKNIDLRYNPWSKTILGKVYQESRTHKRERKQPGLIQSEEYLKWDRTGQAPGGLYGSLQIMDLETNADKKQFESIKKRISGQETVLKTIVDHPVNYNKSLSEGVFDEKSLFPKYILDYEAKMRQEHKVLLAKMSKAGDQSSPGANSYNYSNESAPPSRIGHKKRSSIMSSGFRI